MIGVFDSGVGGLVVLKALRELAPQADLLYFGDTAHMPYGLKSDAEIQELTLRIMAFLRMNGCETIVSACNSVSASVIKPFFELFGVKESSVIEMLNPTIDYLVEQGIKEVVLLGTLATIRSGIHKKIAAERGITVSAMECKTLAQQIEMGESETIIINTIRQILQKVPRATRHVLFGCTHYPLTIDLFHSVAAEYKMKLTFIDPAIAVAKRALQRHGTIGSGKCIIVVSKKSIIMKRYIKNLLGNKMGKVKIVHL